MVVAEPPMTVPRVAGTVKGPLIVKVEVATFAKVLALEKYGMLPTTAAVEVERPPKEIAGVVPPLLMIGKVPDTEETLVEVAISARPPVALDQPRTKPPVELDP